MMRSLYSGVAGLKTHQTKMDVIGNNIANVNTTAYKAQTITFNELMYQTTKRASGASVDTGVGGTNAGQIGLGVKVGSINTNITSQGAMQTTNLPFDIAITGDSFFVVSNGFENFFTRAGSFYIDGAGNLAMTSTGYNVMGWQIDPENPNNIKRDTVTALRVMEEAFLTYEAEATTKGTVSGVIDRNDPDINSSAGKFMNLEFYDDQGFKYTARFSTHVTNADRGEYYTQLVDILDSNGKSIGPEKMAAVTFGQTEEVDVNLSYLRRSNTTVASEIILTDKDGNDITQEVNTTYTVDLASSGTGDDMDLDEIEALYGGDARIAANNAGATYTIAGNGRITISAPGETTKSFAIGATSATDGATAKIENITLSGGGVTIELGGLGGDPMTFTVSSTGVINPIPDIDGSSAADTDDFLAALDAIYGIPMRGIKEFQINPDGTMTVTKKDVDNAGLLRYNPGNGKFNDISSNTDGLMSIQFAQGGAVDMSNFQDIEINFFNTFTNNNNGKSTIGATAGGTGSEKGVGTGRKKGEMIEIVVQDDGRVYANYDNGMSRLLCQIATATFANASGLEKKGDNLYAATMNSGSFDGIGEDIKAGGGYMTSGVLEMSNVDLSSEFTEMITTQRGFQANSRIITVSDSLLEELTNLKR